ncbi:MAG: response regulator [Bryobacterales bacterium]|nr:response regulator [Bryobacterales bacterium]
MNLLSRKNSTQSQACPAETGQIPVVLIVDDDPMSRELLADALSPQQFQVVAVADGVEGLRVLEDLRPAVMLVDIQMPYMDGFEFLAKVRENPKFDAVPMVAVTAYAMVSDASRILKRGFDEYLSKPVPVKTLRQTISRLLSDHPANTTH